MSTVYLTAGAFRADPASAYRLAALCRCVVVLNDRGDPRLIISRQHEPLRRTRRP